MHGENPGHILKPRSGVTHSRSLQTAPFDRSHTSSYWHSKVTMAISCIISEIKQATGQKLQFLHIPSALDNRLGVPHRNFTVTFLTENLQ